MNYFKKLFRKKSYIQTFTYYVPGSISRDNNYREKQFDKVFFEFINRGFEIIEIKTIPHTGENNSGFWAMFIVKGPKYEDLDIDLKIEEEEKIEQIEGIYYLDE